MTVKELMEQLENFELDTEVVMWVSDYDIHGNYLSPTSVGIDEDGKVIIDYIED